MNAADATLRTLFRLHLRYRERYIEEMAAKTSFQSGIGGWRVMIADYLCSVAGRTDAARALYRAGFVVSDFFADDHRAPTLLWVCDGSTRQFRVDLSADASAVFGVVVDNRRLKSIEFDADAMWPAFRRTLRPSAFERMAASVQH